MHCAAAPSHAAPSYYNQVLGVPLGRLGAHLVWPQLCLIPAKFICASWEARLHSRGQVFPGIPNQHNLTCLGVLCELVCIS